MTAANRKLRNYSLGLRAEKAAALWLVLKGYKILKKRFKTPVGEIDLIAKRGKTIVFVEVKARTDADAGLYAVGSRAQARIEQAAKYFLALHPAYNGYDMRFDIIVYAPPFFLRHLDNAWAARS